ncbi:hypothetical protein SDC9_67334 [bioreactor metagenome]|uniref:Uncharacterized protein n=1 Tax=bioreactor metagenome TaxID=1076179 RepID=A0A644XXA5_9ZZZZ
MLSEATDDCCSVFATLSLTVFGWDGFLPLLDLNCLSDLSATGCWTLLTSLLSLSFGAGVSFWIAATVGLGWLTAAGTVTAGFDSKVSLDFVSGLDAGLPRFF